MKKLFVQAALATGILSGTAMASEHGGTGGTSGSHAVSATSKAATASPIVHLPTAVAHQPSASPTLIKAPTTNPATHPNPTAPDPKGSAGHTPNLQASYVKEHGKSFDHGIYYPGKSQSHWTYHCWSGKYGCECYWCPYTCCYYFWYERSCCYYPVSYYTTCCPPVTTVVSVPVYQQPVCPSAPVQTFVQTQTQTQTQSQTAFAARPTSPVGPPPGVPAMPQ